MSSGTVTLLAHHLRSLDHAAQYQLVADLWAARDFEIATADPILTARTEHRTVRVHVGPYHGSPTDVDVVVDVTDRSSVTDEVRVVDARDLAEMFRYALDPETHQALCERHLGGPSSSLRPPMHTRLHDRFAWARTVTPAVGATLLLVATLILAAGTVTVGNPQAPTQVTVPESVGVIADLPVNRSSRSMATDMVAVPRPSYPTPPPGGFLNGSIDTNGSAIRVGTS